MEEEKVICSEVNKVCYSQRRAGEVLRLAKIRKNHHVKKNIPLRSYKCKYCGCWHLTHFRKTVTHSTMRKTGKKQYNLN